MSNSLRFFIDKTEKHLLEKGETLFPVEKEYMMIGLYDFGSKDKIKDKYPTFFNNFDYEDWKFKIRDILYERLNEEIKRSNAKMDEKLLSLSNYYKHYGIAGIAQDWDKHIKIVLNNTREVQLTEIIKLLLNKIQNPPTKLEEKLGEGIYNVNRLFKKLFG